MNVEEARSVIEEIACGKDPVSGKPIPENSPYNHPLIIRALFTVLQAIKADTKPRRSVEERKEENRRKDRPLNAGLPWDNKSRQGVARQFKEGLSIEKIAKTFERTNGAIIAELKRQGVITEEQAKSL